MLVDSREFKICAKCGKELPATPYYFWRDLDSLVGTCKNCCNARRRAKYLYNKDKISEQHKRYYKKYREKIIKKSVRYQQTEHGKDIHNESNRRYRKTPKGKKSVRKGKAIHKQKGYIEMFPSPFSSKEDIEWHHIIGAYVVAIPKDIHKLYTGLNIKSHQQLCMDVVRQIYL